MSTIMTALIAATAVIIFALVMTKPGRAIDAATQRFMLYYAGVFALIGLTASVAVGLVATDRIVMTPGHRVMAQAVHRAVSFGALAFLLIHIVTEILAQRVHVIDAVIPFLSPYRTFYIGLGTIAADLILLIVITSIVRKRFTAHGQAWRWRAIHYAAYLAFVFGVLHGLLGGREAKAYVDWSYGFAIAATALALLVRFLAISLRPKESVSAPAAADRASGGLGYSGTSPLRSAALSLAQAQLGGTIQVLPASTGPHAAIGLSGSQPWAAIPAPGWSASSGPFPALPASSAYAGESPYGGYQNPELMPLGAPVYGDGMAADAAGYPYSAVYPTRSALRGPGPAGHAGEQPWYEPEYDGPPRFMGAPRKHVPQDDVSSYPYGPQSYRQQPGTGYTERRSQPGPAAEATAPGTAQPIQPGRVDRGTGPMPRAGTGPMPILPAGPVPGAGTGPLPRADSGPMPRLGTGPVPRAATGPMPRVDSGPMPRLGSRPTARNDTGPLPRADSGPMPRLGTGPGPRPDTGPMPRASTGPLPRADSGPMPRPGTGPEPRPGAGPARRNGTGPMPRAGTGPDPRTAGPRRANSGPTPGTGPMPRLDSHYGPRPDPAPGAAARRSHRTVSADPGYREAPRRSGGAGC